MSEKKVVLITGGIGFLGKNLGIALKDAYRVILSGRDNKRMQEAARLTGCEVIPLDVTNIESVRDAVNEYKPHIIIHAAATKYVDLAEKFPMECVDINVVGSQNVARVAVDKGVEAVVGISTDKAAPPVRGTYGLSKAIMERIFCSMDSKASTRFVCARYGNVAWSTGSVLPVWKVKLAQHEKISVTDPVMKRFFFTVDDAVALIQTTLQNLGELHGRVVSREMKTARLGDIARIWTESRGGEVEQTGHRPGERLDEYLFGTSELEYTRVQNFNGIKHFIISFNERVSEPMSEPFSTINATMLTEKEVLELISHEPTIV